MQDGTSQTTIDAITVEVVRNGILAITEEMKTNLMRTRTTSSSTRRWTSRWGCSR